jgi:hypothetical protein
MDTAKPRDPEPNETLDAYLKAHGVEHFFLDHGERYKMGLGLYRLHRGTRVHIDAGYRRRSWSRKFVRPLLDSLR